MKTAGGVLAKTGNRRRVATARCCLVLLVAMGIRVGVLQGTTATPDHTPASPVPLWVSTLRNTVCAQ